MKPGTGNGKGTEAICPVCGKKFRRKHKGQVFCNRACSANGRQTWNSRLEYAAKAKKEKKKGRIKNAWNGFKSEFKKISWPSWKQVFKGVLVVLVVVVICAVALGLIDLAFQQGMLNLTKLFS